MNSLRQRLTLLSVGVLLILSFFLGFIAERSLRSSLIEAQKNKMQGLIYALMGAGDIDEEGHFSMQAPERLDARLADPQSSMAAAVFSNRGEILWSSSVSPSLPSSPDHEAGQWTFAPLNVTGEDPKFQMSFGVEWLEGSKNNLLTFVVQESGIPYQNQLKKFRSSLLQWIGAFTFLLILFEYAVLRLGFRPLALFSKQLLEIQDGQREEINAAVPQELSGLRDGMNAVLRHERAQQKRYRHAVDDLAHSLKTPLAVLKTTHPKEPEIDRMDQIIRIQLQRAAAAGRKPFAAPIHPFEQIEKILSALRKAYADRTLRIENRIPPTLTVRFDEADFLEILGNLLDNACKYGGGRIRISALFDSNTDRYVLEDDGPGFSGDPQTFLARGTRGDTQTEGQGIGLAMVAELVRIYEGDLTLDRSPDLHGARITLAFPRS